MSKAINEDAQIHISVAFLIKAMAAVGLAVSSFFQIQNEFAEQDRRIKSLENKVTVLNSIPFNETPIISEDFDGDTSLGIIPRMAGNAIQNLSQGFIMKPDLRAMFKDLGIKS